MKRAKYFCTGEFEDLTKWAHYALSIPRYTHFTSPIRRYADIIVHRMLQRILESSPMTKPEVSVDISISVPPVLEKSVLIDAAAHCNTKKEGNICIE